MMKLVVTILMFVSLSVNASVLTVWGYRDDIPHAPFWMTTLVFHGSDDTACRHALDSFNKMKRMNVSGWICFDGGHELWGEDKR